MASQRRSIQFQRNFEIESRIKDICYKEIKRGGSKKEGENTYL